MRKLFFKFEHPNFWSHNVAMPLLILALYCLLFGHYHAAVRQLPAGVNLAFTGALWPLLLGLASVAGLAYLVSRRHNTANETARPTAGWRPADCVLLLLPLAPVVQYILNNLEILSFGDVAYLLLIFTVTSIILMLLIPNLLSRFAAVSILRVLGLVFAFMITNMASLSATFQWYARGDLWVQLGVALGLFVLIGFLYTSHHRPLLYLLVAGYFLSNSLFQISQTPTPPSTENVFEKNPLFAKLSTLEPRSKPNIYLLIYDSYVINETMLQYGIDNSAQEEFLAEQGFTIYPHNYSIGPASVVSMSSLLNSSTDFYGVPRIGVSGAGIVPTLLRESGYTTYGIFPAGFFFRGIKSSWDITFPERKPAAEVVLDGILIGEFRFDIGFDKQTQEEFVERKMAILQSPPTTPFFLYAHSYSPGHSQDSGNCLPNETELYINRLADANQEMTLDLETVIQNDPTAIIIVAGDHGPYLSKNCSSTSNGGWNASEITRHDIQDRFGAFLAIRWPTENFSEYDQITVLQHVFPSVFAYLFQDTGVLDTRVEPKTFYYLEFTSGVYVEDGIIRGGVNDGEPLFISD